MSGDAESGERGLISSNCELEMIHGLTDLILQECSSGAAHLSCPHRKSPTRSPYLRPIRHDHNRDRLTIE